MCPASYRVLHARLLEPGNLHADLQWAGGGPVVGRALHAREKCVVIGYANRTAYG